VLNKIKKLSVYFVFTGIALLLGFARELIVASKFGLSHELDVYVAVIGFHLFLGVQVGNSLESTFVSKVAKLGGAHHISENFIASFYSLLIINAFMAVFLFVFSKDLIAAIFPSFSAHQQDLSIKIMRYLIITIMFANIAGLMRGGLNAMRDFAPGFMSGSVISLSSIVSVFFFADKIGIDSLIFGFVIGNFLVLIFFATRFLRHGEMFNNLNNANLRTYKPKMFYIWGATAIVLVGECFYQAAAMTERSFASTLKVGTISSFFYATALIMVPLSLIVMPLTTVLFPRMAEAFHRNKQEGIRLLKSTGIMLFLFAIILVLLVSIFADPIIELVYVRGRFSPHDAHRTAAVLSILVFSLPFLSVTRLFTYSFYSISDYRSPVYGHFIHWLLLLLLGVYFVPILGARGLAISSVLSVVLSTTFMFVLLIRRLRHV